MIRCRGNLFAQNTPAHTYTGRENIFPLQSPRLCARTLTSTQNFHKNAHLPLSVAPLLQSRQHKLESGTQQTRHCISFPLQMLYPSFSLPFLFLFFLPAFVSFLLTTFCLQCQVKVTSSFSIFSGQTDTWGATQHVVAKLQGCPLRSNLTADSELLLFIWTVAECIVQRAKLNWHSVKYREWRCHSRGAACCTSHLSPHFMPMYIFRTVWYNCKTHGSTGISIRPGGKDCFTVLWTSNCFFFTDSTNSSENIYTMMNPIGPGGNRPNVSDIHF